MVSYNWTEEGSTSNLNSSSDLNRLLRKNLDNDKNKKIWQGIILGLHGG